MNSQEKSFLFSAKVVAACVFAAAFIIAAGLLAAHARGIL